MSNKQKPITAKLVVLSAPSGSGKSTLAAMLIQRNKSLVLSISHTTRAPRGQEKDGVHYFFIKEKTFEEMIKQGAFLEYAKVFGKNRYGTSKKFVEDALQNGKSVLFDIDVQGATSLKAQFKDRCVSIFVHPPSMEELERRLKNRKTENTGAIEVRLKTAAEEIKQAPTFDHQLVNQDIEQTYGEIVRILKEERCI